MIRQCASDHVKNVFSVCNHLGDLFGVDLRSCKRRRYPVLPHVSGVTTWFIALAIYLNLCERGVYNLIADKEFAGVRHGRQLMLNIRDLESWITIHKAAGMRRKTPTGSVYQSSYRGRDGKRHKSKTWFLKYYLNPNRCVNPPARKSVAKRLRFSARRWQRLRATANILSRLTEC